MMMGRDQNDAIARKGRVVGTIDVRERQGHIPGRLRKCEIETE